MICPWSMMFFLTSSSDNDFVLCPIVYLWMYMVTNSVRYIPTGSMYGIYANIWGILMVNVTIYTIHGSYGICSNFTKIKYHPCVENNWASNRSKQGLARQFFFKSEMPWVCHISVYHHFKKKVDLSGQYNLANSIKTCLQKAGKKPPQDVRLRL